VGGVVPERVAEPADGEGAAVHEARLEFGVGDLDRDLRVLVAVHAAVVDVGRTDDRDLVVRNYKLRPHDTTRHARDTRNRTTRPMTRHTLSWSCVSSVDAGEAGLQGTLECT